MMVNSGAEELYKMGNGGKVGNGVDCVCVCAVLARLHSGIMESAALERVEVTSHSGTELRMTHIEVGKVARLLGIMEPEFAIYGAIQQGLLVPIDKNGGDASTWTLETIFKRGIEVYRVNDLPIFAQEGSEGVLPPFILHGHNVTESRDVLVAALNVLVDVAGEKEGGWITPPKGGLHRFLQEQLGLKDPTYVRPIFDRLVDVGCLQINGGVRSYKRWRIARRTAVSQAYIQEAKLLAMGYDMKPFDDIVESTPALMELRTGIAAHIEEADRLLSIAREILSGRLLEQRVMNH